jgi:hypothetical protein
VDEQLERNEAIHVPARLRAFLGARRHMDGFISFQLLVHNGLIGIEQCCSYRSPSKLAVIFIISIRILRRQALDCNDLQVRSLDRRHFVFRISRYGLAATRDRRYSLMRIGLRRALPANQGPNVE